MKHSTDRILTTHCGSMPRPHDLLDMMKLKITGEPYDHQAFAHRVRSAVAETVRRQVECDENPSVAQCGETTLDHPLGLKQ